MFCCGDGGGFGWWTYLRVVLGFGTAGITGVGLAASNVRGFGAVRVYPQSGG